MNIADFLTDTTKHIPEQPAIRFEGQPVTFAEMNRRVDALANGLTDLGLKPADVCVLMMPNSINWTLVYYALAKLGAVVVPVNFLYRQRELEYMLIYYQGI
jgi:acyl-CoA synthetase (AMP-forming)/AMP-acid ligase II